MSQEWPRDPIEERVLRAENKILQAKVEALTKRVSSWKESYINATNNHAKDKKALTAERDGLAVQCINFKTLLKWMDRKGGMGFDVHDRIRYLLDQSDPSAILASHDAEIRKPLEERATRLEDLLLSLVDTNSDEADAALMEEAERIREARKNA